MPRIAHAIPSHIIPAESWISMPSDRIIDLSVEALQYARSVDHSDIVRRTLGRDGWLDIWPGEHYKLLTGIVRALKPRLVVEIGTATGYSALAIKKVLPADAKIITFDIVSWKLFPNCVLRDEDFQDGRLEQILTDLSDGGKFVQYANLLRNADFIFIDAAKDGVQEQQFINHFMTLSFESRPIFMFDDIRLINMIEIWHNLNKPKLDLTSFGHWSGTGIVDWSAGAL